MADRTPYTGYSEAAGAQAPRFEPTPAFHVDAPAAAFGVTVGQAVQNLGEVQEGAGKEMFQRALAFQDLTNHSTARGAAVKTAQEQAQLWADFDAKGGMDAGPEALQKLQQDLEAVRLRNGANLNPMANEYYQNDAASTQSRLFIYSASHSAQAIKQADKDSITAQRQTGNLLLEGQPHDPSAAEKAYAHNQAAVVLEGHHDGYAPDSPIAKNKLIVYNSETSLHAVQGFIARRDIEGAQKFYDNAVKKGRIAGDYADQAEKAIEQGRLKYGSHAVAERAFNPKDDLATNVDRGVKAADKESGGDPTYAQVVTSRIEVKQAIADKEAKDKADRAVSVINKAMLDNVGQPPKTLEDYERDPAYKEAFGAIQSDQKRAGQTIESLNKLNLQIIQNDNKLTDARSEKATELLGMARDPSQVEDFLKLDLRNVNVTMDQRKELIKIQDAIRSTGSSMEYRDKAVERVMGDMSNTLRDDLHWAKGSTEYNNFRGALYDEFNYLREQGKVVDPAMARDIANKLLQDKVISKGYIWNTKGHAFQPSDDEAAAIRKQLGQNLSDDQVRKIYLRKLNDVLINKAPANAPAGQ